MLEQRVLELKCKNMTCSITEPTMEDALNDDLIYNDQFMLKRHHILKWLPSFTICFHEEHYKFDRLK
jgi:hypothetical protein